MKDLRAVTICALLALTTLTASANPDGNPEKPVRPSITSRLLTCCNPFKVTDPDSIFFSPSHFQFEDYKEEAELAKALDRIIRPGMSRTKIEDILGIVAGATIESETDGRKIYYRRKVMNENQYYRSDGYYLGGSWIISVEYPDKLHAVRYKIESFPEKIGPECLQAKIVKFKLGNHIFMVPRSKLMRSVGDNFEGVSLAECTVIRTTIHQSRLMNYKSGAMTRL